MDDMNIASRIGLRCKRIRESKGLSMQALGDMVGTGAANISKMEKHGIYNIDWITEISKALGQDLLKDEIDEEGIIGEIGKEILIKLIENKGHVLYGDIVSNMHGMSEERVSNEIFKLTRIGMCIREQYKDFDNKHVDMIFITAKGLITCGNQITNPLIEARITPMLSEVITYESLLKVDLDEGKTPPECYQDWIDNRPLEKLIRNLPFTLHRLEFIIWLNKNYTHGIGKLETSKSVDELIPSKGFYYDVLYKMALGIDNEELVIKLASDPTDYFIKHSEDVPNPLEPNPEDDPFEPNPEDDEFERIENKLGINHYDFDFNKILLDNLFAKEFDLTPAEKPKRRKNEIDYSVLSKEEKEFYDNCIDAIRDHFEWEEFVQLSAKERFEKRANEIKAKGIESKYPTDWFSEEEILEYVKNNYKKAADPDEEYVDSQIAKIVEICPDVLKYYKGIIHESVRTYVEEIYNI